MTIFTEDGVMHCRTEGEEDDCGAGIDEDAGRRGWAVLGAPGTVGRLMDETAETWRFGVVDTARAVSTGRVRAAEVMRAMLARIAELPDMLAWEAMDAEQAVADAEGLDRRLASGGRPGVLAGVPVGVKDIIHTAGLRTSAGSKLLRDFVPAADAHCVAAVRTSGGVVVGKTTTTEFAYGDPAPTLNPWDPARTAGGSSTGSAVAVAAGMVPLALGTQTSGSTLRPAAYNGIVGFKPTYGLVSTTGIIPLAWSFDHVGVLVRSVADAGVALVGLTGDGAVARPRPERPLRIGALQGSFLGSCDAETASHVEDVVRELRAEGVAVREVDLSSFYPELMSAFRTVIAAEAAASHEERFARHASDYGPRISALVTRGLGMTAVQLSRATRVLRGLVRSVEAEFANVDFLLSASTPSPAPADLDSTGDPNNLVVGSAAGLPSISIPSGLSRSGLPFGIQLVGRRYADAELLAVAGRLERMFAFSAHPPCWEGAPGAAVRAR